MLQKIHSSSSFTDIGQCQQKDHLFQSDVQHHPTSLSGMVTGLCIFCNRKQAKKSDSELKHYTHNHWAHGLSILLSLRLLAKELIYPIIS